MRHCVRMPESKSWFAVGIDLHLAATEDGGRSKPLGAAGYKPYEYRPNWRVPGMAPPNQIGAPVLHFGATPLYPGDRTRAVIVPFAATSLDLWRALNPGDELVLLEGPRICGQAHVAWITATTWPVLPHASESFMDWCTGGSTPSGC